MTGLPTLEVATQRLQRAAAAARAVNALTTSAELDAWDIQAYDAETTRIAESQLRARKAKTTPFFPALYLRARDPAGEETVRLMRTTCKAFELDLRFKEIERLDEMHAKFWELLNTGERRSITLQEYEAVLDEFNAWAAEHYGAQLPPPPRTVWEVSSADDDNNTLDEKLHPQGERERDALTGSRAPPVASTRTTDSAGAIAFLNRSPAREEGRISLESGGCEGTGSTGRRSQSWGAVEQHIQRFREQQELRRCASISTNSPITVPPPSATQDTLRFAHYLRLAEDEPALGDVLYLSSVRPPRPDMQLFLSCPRNGEHGVDLMVLYQAFAKQVSLVKCEAELIMWDSNNDGRLSEDELENYVRDLAPRIAALAAMTPDMLPFYCCTVSRRLFWDLDPGNRGILRIHSLLQSSVMDEWVRLQLLSEDDPHNWFGATVTQQLYSKFVMLDTRNKGTLNVANLRKYKKGLPTVLDDGLPLEASPLCSLFIDRYFETNTLMTRSELDYRKFVDFVIAVELLPQCSRPQFFWNILDTEGSGALTPMVVNQFFRETHAKLVAAGLEVPSRETVVQEVFDLIEKAEPLRITREEFVSSPHAGLFMGLLIDCLSFWTYENREQR